MVAQVWNRAENALARIEPTHDPLQASADAAFIAHARDDIPRLLAALEAKDEAHRRTVEALREREICWYDWYEDIKGCHLCGGRWNPMVMQMDESHALVNGHPCEARPWEGRET